MPKNTIYHTTSNARNILKHNRIIWHIKKSNGKLARSKTGSIYTKEGVKIPIQSTLYCVNNTVIEHSEKPGWFLYEYRIQK